MGTLPGRGSSGCRAAIDLQIHGVLTGWSTYLLVGLFFFVFFCFFYIMYS